MPVNVSHQLIGFLAARIKTRRVVDALVLGRRQSSHATIGTTAAGINEMAKIMIAATF